jgi:aryl carrier-like protein
MVPGTIVRVTELPLGPTGKLDYGALAALETGAAASTAPRNEAERFVAAVWQEVLRRDPIGVHDNFFELGGHSLLLVQVHNRLRERYPDLPVSTLFDYPTIDALARHLGGALSDGAAAPAAETRARSLSEGRGRLGQRLQMKERTQTRPADA